MYISPSHSHTILEIEVNEGKQLGRANPELPDTLRPCPNPTAPPQSRVSPESAHCVLGVSKSPWLVGGTREGHCISQTLLPTPNS